MRGEEKREVRITERDRERRDHVMNLRIMQRRSTVDAGGACAKINTRDSDGVCVCKQDQVMYIT